MNYGRKWKMTWTTHMKTRQELILEFMMAIVAGGQYISPAIIYDAAAELADKYLENLS